MMFLHLVVIDTPTSRTPQSMTPQREPSPLPSPAPPLQPPSSAPGSGTGGADKEEKAPCEYENILLIKVCWVTVGLKSRQIRHSPSRETGRRNSGRSSNYCASLLSVFRQVSAHMWHRGMLVSRQKWESNPGPMKWRGISSPGPSALTYLRQAIHPTDLPPISVLVTQMKLERCNVPHQLSWGHKLPHALIGIFDCKLKKTAQLKSKNLPDFSINFKLGCFLPQGQKWPALTQH